MTRAVRGPVEQFLGVVVPGFEPSGRPRHAQAFADELPGFFDYLVAERGLRPASVLSYHHHLDRFEVYLRRIGVESIGDLSPAVLSGFVVERAAAGLAKSTVRDSAGVLRVFLRYAHREGVVASDLSNAVGWPQVYRLSDIPRSIPWRDVNRVLAGVDRRTAAGRRDYAILLLLVTYGRLPELGLLFGRQTIDLASVDALLPAPVVDRLIADLEIVRDAGHASSLGEQIENLASKLG